MMNDEHLIEEQILNLLYMHQDGVNKEVISAQINRNDEEIVASLNNLIQSNRISLTELNGETLFKYRSEKDAVKFRDMSKEEISVYETIRQSGNSGLTTNEIKMKLRISSTTLLNKILKKHEKKLLIKSLKMVNMKNKKIWIGFDIEPSQEVTGGVWCNNQEFDSDKVVIFTQKCYDYIERHQTATRKEILMYSKSLNISTGEIKEDDIQKIINILIFENKIDPIFPDSMVTSLNKFAMLLKKSENNLNSIKYKISRNYQPKAIFSCVPCTFCPVFKECQIDNKVNPIECPWLQEYIK